MNEEKIHEAGEVLDEGSGAINGSASESFSLSEAEIAIETIRTLRIELDRDMKVWKFASTAFSAMMGKAADSLSYARMWLGKVSHYLGAPYPYPENTNPNTIIAEAVDTFSGKFSSYPDTSEAEILHIKQKRAEISEMLVILKSFTKFFAIGDNGWIALTQSKVHLTETNFALGLRLAEIKASEDMAAEEAEARTPADPDFLGFPPLT